MIVIIILFHIYVNHSSLNCPVLGRAKLYCQHNWCDSSIIFGMPVVATGSLARGRSLLERWHSRAVLVNKFLAGGCFDVDPLMLKLEKGSGD